MNTNHEANSGSVQAYSVLSNGSLLPINSAPGDTAVSAVEINTAGNALYSAGLNYMSAYSLDRTTGEIKLVAKVGSHTSPTSIVLTGGSATVAYSPELAIVASTGDNQITSYSVATDGMLSNPQSVAALSGPSALSALPWGKQVLVASVVPEPALSSYLFGAAGGLQFVRNFGASTTSSGVAIDPSGIWAVDVDSASNGVHVYGDAGQYGLWGTWTSNFYPTGANPGPIAIDSVGRYMFIGNRDSDSITVFERSTGWISLTEMASAYTGPYIDGSPYTLSASPLQLVADQNGSFLYVRCSDNTIQVFSIDYSSGGHLKPVASTTLTGTGAGVTVIPMSNAFVAADTNGLHAFTLNPSTDTVTAVDSVALSNVNGVYADPAGGTIYATTSITGDGAIYAYTADGSGHLVPAASNPVARSKQPSSMTFKSLIQ
jgi:6-phosphogluconolactonase (cycloisomerase 2 family)